MEKNSSSVEGSYQASASDNGVSKSMGGSQQPIQIEAISIDLNFPMPVKEEMNCHHFSIRGYVAEMRKGANVTCSPFGSSSNHDKPDVQLPPLDVPKFKWWKCENCLHEVGAESEGDEIGNVVARIAASGVAYLLSEKKDVSDSKKGDENKEIMDDTSGTNLIILAMKREKVIGTPENKTIKAVNSSGDGNGSKSVGKEEIGDPITEVKISKQCSTQKLETNNPVENLLNNSTKVAVSEPTLSKDANGKVVHHANRRRCADDRVGDIDPEKSSQNCGQRTTSITSNQIDVLGSKDKVLNTSNVKLSKLPSLELREGGKTSKGSGANLAQNGQSESDEDSANHAKTQLLSLLTELIDRRNLEARLANAEQCSQSIIPVVPCEPDTVVPSKDKVSVTKNVGQGTKISQKKRKMSPEDVSKLELSSDGEMAKRLRGFNQKVERSSKGIKIFDTCPGENGSDREHLHSGSKRVRINRRSDKDSGVNKKKQKQAQLDDGYSPQMSWKGKSIDIGTNRYDANILFQPHASTSGKVEPHLRNDHESLLGKESNSGLCKNSNKLLEVRHASSLMNVNADNNLQRKRSTKGKDVVQMRTGPEMVTSQEENELSAKLKLDQSLSSYRNCEKRVVNDIIQRKNTTRPLILQKGSKSCDPLKKVNTLVRQSHLFELGEPSRKGLICDLNQGIAPTSSMWQEIQNSPSFLQTENPQVSKQTEMAHSYSRGNLNEGKGKSYTINPQRNQRSKKVVGKGPSDDMPVEIVELLARNQFERRLSQSKSNLVIERNDNGSVTWFNPGFHLAHANKHADVGSSRGNSPNLSNGKVNSNEMIQVQEPQFKLFGGTIPQSQQKPSNGGQVSVPVPTRWESQRGEGSKPAWFPAAQSITFGHDIPQKSLNQANRKIFHGQASGSLQKGKTISDIKSVESERQSEWRQTSQIAGNAEHNKKRMGSSNAYSSESITAMQLLSLMNQRMSSNPAFNVDTNKLHEKPFTPCNYHPLVHVDGKQRILNGSFLANHPSKKSSSVQTGGYTAGPSSRQPVRYFNDQVSFQSQVPEKPRTSHAPVQLVRRKLQNSASPTGLLRTTRVSGPDKDVSRGIVGTSCSRVPTLQADNAPKSLDVEVFSTPQIVVPFSSISEKNPPCLFNRNPADISFVDDEKSPYTRTAEDQTILNRSSSRENSGAVHLDVQKRKRRGRLPLQRRAP